MQVARQLSELKVDNLSWEWVSTSPKPTGSSVIFISMISFSFLCINEKKPGMAVCQLLMHSLQDELLCLIFNHFNPEAIGATSPPGHTWKKLRSLSGVRAGTSNPWVHHFLSYLCPLTLRATNQRHYKP